MAGRFFRRIGAGIAPLCGVESAPIFFSLGKENGRGRSKEKRLGRGLWDVKSHRPAGAQAAHPSADQGSVKVGIPSASPPTVYMGRKKESPSSLM